jgi:ribosomal protein S18 acetylase RimI-like enzyme
MTPAYQPVIRAATTADAEVLAELSERTFLETFVTDGFRIPYPTDDLAVFLEEVYSIEVTHQRLADPRHWWEIAEIDGIAVAFCEVGPATMPHDDCKPKHGEIRRLYVAKEAQGLGLGTALLERALARMDETPGPQWLSVWSGNEKAQKLYRCYGFDKVGEYGFPVGAWRDHEFIFRRDRS